MLVHFLRDTDLLLTPFLHKRFHPTMLAHHGLVHGQFDPVLELDVVEVGQEADAVGEG